MKIFVAFVLFGFLLLVGCSGSTPQTNQTGVNTTSRETTSNSTNITSTKSCSDGTYFGECSTTKPKLCTIEGLVDAANMCGCQNGYTINGRTCEKQTASKPIENNITNIIKNDAVSTTENNTTTNASTINNTETNQSVNETPAQIKLCEVIYDPPGEEPADEMIKICNSGSTAIDIGGWELTDGEGTYDIPAGTTIQPGSSWSVFGRTYNPTRYTRGLYLANTHDSVILIDNNRNIIDQKQW